MMDNVREKLVHVRVVHNHKLFKTSAALLRGRDRQADDLVVLLVELLWRCLLLLLLLLVELLWRCLLLLLLLLVEELLWCSLLLLLVELLWWCLLLLLLVELLLWCSLLLLLVQHPFRSLLRP